MTALEQIHAKAQKAISSALEPGEEIVLAIPGETGSAMVATDRRVFVYKKGAASGAIFGKQLNSWYFSNVTGIEVKQGMTTHGIVLQIPGVTPVTKFGRFDSGSHSVWEAPNAVMARKGTFDQAVSMLRQLIYDYQHKATSQEPTGPDAIEQIRRLADLRDQGILTEEEFQAKKKQLLAL